MPTSKRPASCMVVEAASDIDVGASDAEVESEPVRKRPAAAEAPPRAGPEGEKRTKAQEAVLRVANGSTASADMQGVMNFLKSMAKQGRPEVLQQYRKTTSQVSKRDFVHKLSLDWNASFVSVEEDQQAAKNINHVAQEGWMFKWQVADLNKIPYTDDNKPIIDAIVQDLESKDSDKPAMKAAGPSPMYVVIYMYIWTSVYIYICTSSSIVGTSIYMDHMYL